MATRRPRAPDILITVKWDEATDFTLAAWPQTPAGQAWVIADWIIEMGSLDTLAALEL